MHEQLNRLFDDYLGGRPASEGERGAWVPAVDLREEQHRYVLQADLPGVKREDLEINLENNILTIRGERRFEGEVKKDNYHRIERAYGRFLRTFTLPARVDAAKITASHKEGILEVVIPKAEESLPKKIEIKS
jgi:HSP20 family protein